MKVSKLTAMDVENCFQLPASLVFITIITFISNVQRHPLKFLITLSIPNTQTQVFFFDKGHTLMMTWEKCNGCGNDCWHGAFRCGKCRFALDFRGLTLPHSALHKIDEHMLNLTYDDDKEQCYCDICEQERDPNFWYYSCSICNTSAHPKCVLGEFPFLKDGMKWPYVDHPHRHDLKFFRNVESYSKCSDCGKLCPEEVIKCEKPTCNYITHYHCP
ncbi:hypothetical protein ES332_A06G202800v1 [Gossypium tomentosum]|uniref:DC1 domain-containing protein n=1 Tax=Gossypium tomentosum TaxID=34277 RepID=A0A5D2Q9S9_GOSTO|nr:hypothetical protein ES332_A06G202800v1 [Gossypium tomentosum]